MAKSPLLSPEFIKKSDVKKAARQWDRDGRFRDFHNSTRYDVLINKVAYPPKAICGMAFENATGTPLSSADFKGAKDGPWQTRLNTLGFPVVLKNSIRSSKVQKKKKPIIGPELREMLRTFGRAEGAVLLTFNKFSHASGNFQKIRGRKNQWADGDWRGQPKVKPTWGVHYEAPSTSGDRAKIWYGKWVTSRHVSTDKNGTKRFQFIYEDVIGPIETTASFKETFGVTPPQSFRYLTDPSTSQKSKARNDEALAAGLKKLVAALEKKALRGTDIEALVKRRLFSGSLKKIVLRTFDAKCCLTGLELPALLVCSHIRPWAESSHSQRVDPSNTLLLAANWDALFDRYLVSFDSRGKLIVAKSLVGSQILRTMGARENVRLSADWLTPERLGYLRFHRETLQRRECS